MKKIILEYLQECINFGVKKFNLKYNEVVIERFEPSIVWLLYMLSQPADYKRVKGLQGLIRVNF